MSELKVGMFVDVNSLYFSTKDIFNSKIDYAKLYNLLAKEDNVVVARAYTLLNDKAGGSPFEIALEIAGFTIKNKSMNSCPKNSWVWDVGMTLDIVSWANKLDTVIIASNSENIIDLIRHLESNGTNVELAAFKSKVSKTLFKVPSFFTDLGDPQNDILFVENEENGNLQVQVGEKSEEAEINGNK